MAKRWYQIMALQHDPDLGNDFVIDIIEANTRKAAKRLIRKSGKRYGATHLSPIDITRPYNNAGESRIVRKGVTPVALNP